MMYHREYVTDTVTSSQARNGQTVFTRVLAPGEVQAYVAASPAEAARFTFLLREIEAGTIRTDKGY